MKIKQILAGLLSAAMILSIGEATAFAAESNTVLVIEDGTYTPEVHMYKDGDLSDYSMCAGAFAKYGQVIVNGDTATVKIYPANPLPNWSWITTSSGVVTSPKVKYSGTTYSGSIGVKNAGSLYFDKTSSLLGTEAGKSYTCDTITFVLPTEILFETHLDLTGTMKTPTSMTHDFDCVLVGLPIVEVELPEIQESEVTAFVPINPTTYTVTIPENLGFGMLHSEEDASVDYTIEVEVFNGNDDKEVRVTAEAEGELEAGNDSIAFTNSFGEQMFSATGTGAGSLFVSKEAIAAVRSGDYAGTLRFVIDTVESDNL